MRISKETKPNIIISVVAQAYVIIFKPKKTQSLPQGLK